MTSTERSDNRGADSKSVARGALIKSTHEGTVDFGGGPIACYVLEDGQRVLVASQIQGLLGAAKDRHLDRQLARLDHGSARLNLRPITFVSPSGQANGYGADDVAKVLAAYMRAFLRGSLHHTQEPIAMRAMAALESFATVGIQALIDEATGHKAKPGEHQDAYSRLFLDKMAMWHEQFDADWDRTLCLLYGHDYEGRPPAFAKSINAMVYRLAFGEAAFEELKRRNPEPSHHKNHHQLITDEAKIKLSQTINTVRGIAKLSRTPRDFLTKLGVVYKGAPMQSDWW